MFIYISSNYICKILINYISIWICPLIADINAKRPITPNDLELCPVDTHQYIIKYTDIAT